MEHEKAREEKREGKANESCRLLAETVLIGDSDLDGTCTGVRDS
jgi:hypothetical protein